MSLTVVNTVLDIPSGARWRSVNITFDSSYNAGGEALIPSDIGLNGIIAAVPAGTASDGRQVLYDGANGKLKVFEAAPTTRLRTYKVAGTTAGDVTVTGVALTDNLLAVLELIRDATAANVNIADLTSEFTITATNKINNTAGTDTTGNSLWVVTTRPADGVAAVEVAAGTDLHLVTVQLLVVGVA